MAGYSGTPLVQKLGIKPGMLVALLDAPDGFLESLEGLPDDLLIVNRLGGDPFDLALAFVTTRAGLKRRLAECLPRMEPDGLLWIAWPKKASKVPTDVTEDVVRELALPLDLVDVKVCAISEMWSGLKLVIRKELRAARRESSAPGSKPGSKPEPKPKAKPKAGARSTPARNGKREGKARR